MKKNTMTGLSILGVSLAAGFFLRKYLNHSRQAAVLQPEHPLHSESQWDKVDEASWESFPASDAPSYSEAESRIPTETRVSTAYIAPKL